MSEVMDIFSRTLEALDAEEDDPPFKVGEIVDVVFKPCGVIETWPFKVTRIRGRQLWGRSEPVERNGRLLVAALMEVPLQRSWFSRREKKPC